MRAITVLVIRVILATTAIAFFALVYGIALLWETFEDGAPALITRPSEGHDAEPGFPAPLGIELHE